MNGKSGQPRYWFPARRYGWGWGPPTCWQGWVVMAVWVAVLIGGQFVLSAHRLAHVIFVVAMVVVLLVIYWLKGEPPRWRWGGK